MERFICYIARNIKTDILMYKIFKFIMLHLNIICFLLIISISILGIIKTDNVYLAALCVSIIFVTVTFSFYNIDMYDEYGDYIIFKTVSYKKLFKNIENES